MPYDAARASYLYRLRDHLASGPDDGVEGHFLLAHHCLTWRWFIAAFADEILDAYAIREEFDVRESLLFPPSSWMPSTSPSAA